MFEQVPFVGSEVFTERKLKMQVFEVKYDRNFLQLMNLGKTGCNTAE